MSLDSVSPGGSGLFLKQPNLIILHLPSNKKLPVSLISKNVHSIYGEFEFYEFQKADKNRDIIGRPNKK